MNSTSAVLASAAAQLGAVGIDSPRVDAELLLAHVLDVPRSKLITRDTVEGDALAEFERLCARRANREPLQYVLGTTPFRHLEISVGSGVFIPRPETELLVDAVLPLLRSIDRPLAVDLCTGSGALALALADEVPGCRVVAVERSADAITWLRKNVMSFLTGDTQGSGVAIEPGDVLDSELLADMRGLVDVVVSNPPYVPSSTDVSPEVRADPPEAVFSGEDGLDLMPHVIARSAELLRSGGVLAVEHDDTNAAGVVALLAEDGHWREVDSHQDLAARPRYVVAIRS